MALYAWNADVSGALGTTFGHLEVLLRNAMHEVLTAWSTRYRATRNGWRFLHLARNRLAHHEPMFNRPIDRLRAVALDAAEWICPVTRAWIESRCRVPQVLAARPTPPTPQHPGRSGAIGVNGPVV
jgi:hypothetical protein